MCDEKIECDVVYYVKKYNIMDCRQFNIFFVLGVLGIVFFQFVVVNIFLNC